MYLHKSKVACVVCILMLAIAKITIGQEAFITSPSGKIVTTLQIEKGHLTYKVNGSKRQALLQGAAGLVMNQHAWGREVQAFYLQQGETIRQSGSKYNKYKFAIKEHGIIFFMEFIVADQGVGFRYLFKGMAPYLIEKELTTFQLPHGPVWFFERDNDWKLKSYAGLWQKTVTDSLHIISKQGPVQGKPLLMALPNGHYALLTEAALYHYSGMRLRGIGNRTLQVDFTEKNGFVINEQELITPWRVLLYTDDLNDLVNQTMIRDLNPAPDPQLYADKSYIRPGKSVWSWITKGAKYLDPVEEKQFIKAAAELNFEYTLIDDGWEKKWTDKWNTLQDLCAFGAEHKVGVWIWKHSKELRDTVYRNLFLDSLQKAGVAGIKTDFMDSEAKELIDFEIGLLKAAAQRKLMVNFHGCHAPTGESKTYPNELTREAIRGMELNVMKEPIPAWHNAALPFTRLVLGPGDYTPGFFSNRGKTTLTHQLALLYLFNSPFQCIAENPLHLISDTLFKPILPFLKRLPVVWDETIVLKESKIGELVVFARRKGACWYLIIINGTSNQKKISVPLSFLGAQYQYDVESVGDTDSKRFLVKKESMRGNSTIPVNLFPGGGQVSRIAKLE